MTTTLLLLLSGVLIGSGVGLIWRDVHKKRRDAFVLQRDIRAETAPTPELEITISRPADHAGGAPAHDRAAMPSRASPADAYTPVTAEQWEAVRPALETALRQVNAVLAGAGVAVGALGQPLRSINGGYASSCSVSIAGERVASLRLELTPHEQVHAGVRALGKDAAAINASSSAPVRGLSAARASDLLSEALKPAAAFAMRVPGGDDHELRASELAWSAVDAVITAALEAANGALAQAGARFVPLGAPSWNAQLRRHRLAIAVEVFQNDVARMHIERIAGEMEVAVGLPDARLIDLGRRRRVPLHGMTTHVLAELIASCAWPAITHFREARRLA
jgi:hypothetical protein